MSHSAAFPEHDKFAMKMEQYVEFREADGKIFTKNKREYPKTEGAIPSGRSPRGIATPRGFGMDISRVWSEYCQPLSETQHIAIIL